MKGDLQFGLILLLVVALVTLPRTIKTSDFGDPAVGTPGSDSVTQQSLSLPALPAPTAPSALPAPTAPEIERSPAPASRPAPNALTDISPDGYSGSRPTAGPVLGNVPNVAERSIADERGSAAADRRSDDTIHRRANDLADSGPEKKTDRSTDREPASTPKGPVHPFFQRYLDRGEYFVREGDTLRDIALRLYQDDSMVAELLRANRSLLATADDLRPGMMLRLPRQ